MLPPMWVRTSVRSLRGASVNKRGGVRGDDRTKLLTLTICNVDVRSLGVHHGALSTFMAKGPVRLIAAKANKPNRRSARPLFAHKPVRV